MSKRRKSKNKYRSFAKEPMAAETIKTSQDYQEHTKLANQDCPSKDLAEEQLPKKDLVEKIDASHDDVLMQERQDMQEQLALLSRLFEANFSQNQFLLEFDRILHTDFLDLLGAINPPNAKQDYATLQAIKEKLQALLSLPNTHAKNLVGVCGSFSSGKSAFINSLIDPTEIKLTEGVNPITAVASYVTHSDHASIYAHTPSGSGCSLDVNAYARLSHETQKKYGSNIKSLLKSVSVGVPMTDPSIFSRLCLVDTPGYNPSQDGATTGGDYQTAFDFASQTDALIWVMRVDQGTMTTSDIDFIENLQADGYQGKLYIILNRADLVPLSTGKDILEEVVEKLEDAYIQYDGISLYSSTQRKEYAYEKQSLKDFLRNCSEMTPSNQSSDTTDGNLSSLDAMHQDVDQIFDTYMAAIDMQGQEMQDVNNAKNLIKSIRLDLLQHCDDNAYATIARKLANVEVKFVKNLRPYSSNTNNQILSVRSQLRSLIGQVERQLH